MPDMNHLPQTVLKSSFLRSNLSKSYKIKFTFEVSEFNVCDKKYESVSISIK